MTAPAAGAVTLSPEWPSADHDVRVRRSGTGLTVYCDPCRWREHVENGHSPAFLAGLQARHEGRAS